MYPTRVRALGSGAATAWLRIASILGPLIVGSLVANEGVANAFLVFGLVVLLASAVVGLFATETSDRLLEEVSP